MARYITPATAHDWYWLKGDGKTLFSTAAGGLVPLDSPAYAAWLAAGNQTSQWPRDMSGAETDAALQDVLSGFGLTMDGKPKPATIYDFLGFLALFSPSEQDAIINSPDTRIKLFCLMAAGAPDGVDLSSQTVIGGVNLLESLGLIGKGRAAQVLAGQAPPSA